MEAKMNTIKSKLLCVSVFCFLLFACSGGVDFANARDRFSLASWNVQTFFDGETSGNEYDEFKGASSSWSRDKYQARLKRLCESIKQFDADVLAFEEIENEAILYDIANELTGLLPQNKLYGYACFATSPGSSIGCAVFSRFPIEGLTVHSCDEHDALGGYVPLMRPLMEVTLSVAKTRVKLFVAHWKSKSGGEDVAAKWQGRQESVLAHRVNQFMRETGGEGVAVACGDFNRDLSEFSINDDGTVTLTERTASLEESAVVGSGWLLFPELGEETGSYFFRNEWEKIDHVFIAGAAALSEFDVLADGPWVKDSDGKAIPYRYAIGNGSGYSDHLPLRCVVTWRKQ
jgi:endonuclease/exonuclease/phosphatase family metal-dependent hydrolase